MVCRDWWNFPERGLGSEEQRRVVRVHIQLAIVDLGKIECVIASGPHL